MINSICRRSAVMMLSLCMLALAACSGGAVGRCASNAITPDLGIRFCTVLINSGRNLGETYHNRGNHYFRIGQYRQAIEDYDQAVRINPKDSLPYFSRGLSYRRLGDFKRAVADWEQSLRLGGAREVKDWQKYLKGNGHYAGAIDGVFVPDMRPALLACAVDPGCMN